MKRLHHARYATLRRALRHPALAGRDARFRRAVLTVLLIHALFLLSCLVEALHRRHA